MFDFLEEREQEFNQISDNLGLPEFVKRLPYSLLGKPYHNSHHLRTVAINAYSIAKSEGLDQSNATVAFISGACHDIGYIDHFSETTNIFNAITAFKNVSPLLSFTDEQRSYGSALIANTDSSFTKEFNQSHSDMWIVHDADMSVWMNITPEEAEYLCSGIEKEMAIPTDVHSTRSFLQQTGMGTITGQQMMEEFSNKVLTTRVQGKWLSYI